MTFGKLIDKIVGSWFVRKITSCGRSPRRCRSSRSPPARSSWAGWGSRCGSRGRSRRRTAAGRRSPRSRRGCTNQRGALGHVTSWGPMRTDLQVLHSMHCQGYFLTLIIMLGVNWRQVGWPAHHSNVNIPNTISQPSPGHLISHTPSTRSAPPAAETSC